MAGDATEHDAAGPLPALILDLPRRRLDLSHTVAVMGICNVTPDSFYDRGATASTSAAVDRALALAERGATIVDIGGVKVGPGADVDAAEEARRVLPVVEEVRARSDVVISVDTWRAEVADAALASGADIVNDISGGSEPAILDVVADHDAAYVAVHRGGPPRGRPFRPAYVPDVTAAVVRHLRELLERARSAGIADSRLVVDPGHDLGKSTHHSIELTRRLSEIAALQRPVLVALSNKDFVGEVLGADVGHRVDGSLAAAVFSITQGARIVRVHEVGRTADAVRMTEVLLGWRHPRHAVRGLE